MTISDYVYGASAAFCSIALFNIWQLFRAPSPESIERKATAPTPHMGDDDKITIFGFDNIGEHPGWSHGVSDASNYVSRVEAYLRLVNIPYCKKAIMNPAENPRGKVPWANIKGEMADDSSRIIALISSKFGVDPDEQLTDDQKNTGHLIQQLLMGSLYWVMLHQKFNSSEGRAYFQKHIESNIKVPIIPVLVSKMVFRGMSSSLYGCGISRMPKIEIIKKGQDDVRCLSKLLGDRKFFFGDKNPSSYDCDVFSWLALLFYDEIQSSNEWVIDIKKECKNLVDFTERMRIYLYKN